jgi:hypothetical protein
MIAFVPISGLDAQTVYSTNGRHHARSELPAGASFELSEPKINRLLTKLVYREIGHWGVCAGF